MKSGQIDKRVTFQNSTPNSDGAGGAVRTWVDFRTVWAQFSPERARERIQNGRMTSAQSGVLRIRSSGTARQINETFRVLIDDVVMNIRSRTLLNDMIEFTVETDGTAS